MTARFDLRGKVCVITGAAAGIGAALARELASAGARVALLDRDAEGAERGAAALRRSGSDAMAASCDVTDEDACRRAIAGVCERWGAVDVVVCNAGVTQLGRVVESETEPFRRIFDVNFFGALYSTMAALPSIVERRGAVVVVSSVAGFAPLYGRSGYSASKHALHGFFDTLRSEMAASGVSVTVVCPTFVATDIEKSALGSGARPTVGTPMSADRVAREIRRGIEGRRRLVLVGRVAHLSWWLTRLAPALYERIMTRRMSGGGAAASQGG